MARRDTITIKRPVVPHGPSGMAEDAATAMYHMPPAQAHSRSRELAWVLVRVLDEYDGTMPTVDLLRVAAARQRHAASEMKHGLNYGVGAGLLSVDGSSTAALVSPEAGELTCVGCLLSPAEIHEYRGLVEDGEFSSVEDAVRHGEGTYNAAAGTFYCTGCYIDAGTPLGVAPALAPRTV